MHCSTNSLKTVIVTKLFITMKSTHSFKRSEFTQRYFLSKLRRLETGLKNHHDENI